MWLLTDLSTIRKKITESRRRQLSKILIRIFDSNEFIVQLKCQSWNQFKDSKQTHKAVFAIRNSAGTVSTANHSTTSSHCSLVPSTHSARASRLQIAKDSAIGTNPLNFVSMFWLNLMPLKGAETKQRRSSQVIIKQKKITSSSARAKTGRFHHRRFGHARAAGALSSMILITVQFEKWRATLSRVNFYSNFEKQKP